MQKESFALVTLLSNKLLLSYVFIRASHGFPHSSVGKESTCNAGDPGLIPGSGRFAGEGIGYPLQYSWASLVAQLVKSSPQCGRPGFDPWVGKIPWRREWLPTPVFWPGEFHGLYSPWGLKESDMTAQPSRHYVFVLLWGHSKLTFQSVSVSSLPKDKTKFLFQSLKFSQS